MKNLLCKILTPQQIVFKGECVMFEVPTYEGQIGILNGHTPLVSKAKCGLVRMSDGKQVTEVFHISSGIVNVSNYSVVLLVNQAINKKDIDLIDITKKFEDLQKIIASHDKNILQRSAKNLIEFYQSIIDLHGD